MRKLDEVHEAKDLMNQAFEWSTFKWLFEKPRVRKSADLANAALDKLEKNVKAKWTDEAKAAYKKLSAKPARGGHGPENSQQESDPAQQQLDLLIEQVVKADHAAHRARMDAEDTFEQAEKQMNIGLAREGCKKAIHSWELHEKAIRKAEALAQPPHIPLT